MSARRVCDCKIDEAGERISLTICDFDREKGTITIVFQTVGASTYRMAFLKEGDSFQDVAGPLGNPSEFVKESVGRSEKKKVFVCSRWRWSSSGLSAGKVDEENTALKQM